MERYINNIRERPPYYVSDHAREAHDRLTVVDLHADSLLWKRDLLKRSNYGHIDIDRLMEGNVAIQVFGVVTKYPITLNLTELSFTMDLVTLLSFAHKWPRQTRANLFQRALYQNMKLSEMTTKSKGRMKVIKSVRDLDHFLMLRKNQPKIIGALLALEGAHALNSDLSNMDKLYDLSFRIFGISHFFDNEAGGSAHGKNKYGLTEFGNKLIKKLQELHMIIDLAHASERVVDEVTELVENPVIVSHTGVRGICDNPRNLSDNQIRKIAKIGGIIGIAMFKEAVCGKQIKDTARAIRYVADMVGVDHAGIGSDFDGAITAPIDASGLPLLTEELFLQGFSESQIVQIMGGNALRVLRQTLPKE